MIAIVRKSDAVVLGTGMADSLVVPADCYSVDVETKGLTDIMPGYVHDEETGDFSAPSSSTGTPS